MHLAGVARNRIGCSCGGKLRWRIREGRRRARSVRSQPSAKVGRPELGELPETPTPSELDFFGLLDGAGGFERRLQDA